MRSSKYLPFAKTLILSLFAITPSLSMAVINDIVVKVNNVSSLDQDPFLGQDENDLYSLVDIAHQGFQQSPVIDNANNAKPSDWVFTRRIDQAGSVVPVNIQLWDEDIGPDDQIDISPIGKDLNMQFDMSSGAISGDISRPTPGDGMNGSVDFSISSRAVTDHSEDIVFSTTGQSMWGTGSSVAGSFNYFLGAQWDTSGSAGHVADVTVIPGGCLPWWLGGGCWDSVNSSFGAEVGGHTDGKVGLDIGAKWDSGTVNVTYPVKTNLYFPEDHTVKTGESFLISSDYAVATGGSMTTVFPQATINVDAVLDVYANLGGKICIAGCLGDTFDLINVDQRVNLLNIDTTKSFSANFPANLGSITASLPNVKTQSTVTGKKLVSTGNDDILNAKLDLDGVLTSLLGLPPLEAGFSALGTSFSYNILDIEAGLTANIKQTFSLDPVLMVTLENSSGQQVSFAAGEGKEFVMGEDWFSFTPEYWMKAVLTNTTQLSIIPDLTISALSASAAGASFGPVFEKTFKTSFDVDMFNQSFEVGGFQRFKGQTITIYAVPEPSAIMLIMLGLYLIAFNCSNRLFYCSKFQIRA